MSKEYLLGSHAIFFFPSQSCATVLYNCCLT
nr:MAG TPA_asm: hypothetical protein [Caudoviricetes sp.]